MNKSIIYFAAAFLLLILSSAIRRLDIQFAPQLGRVFTASNPVRQLVAFCIEVILLAGWWASILRRVTQRNMRVFLIAEHFIMLFWVFVRLLQATVFYSDMYISRVSGYLAVFPSVLVPVLGLFASFGLGKPEDFRISKKWYLLFIPAAVLITLVTTNESHNLVFRVIENEGESLPNVYFHQNFGIYVVVGCAFCFLFARIILIYKRSRRSKETRSFWNVPLTVAVIMLLFNIPYILLSYVVTFEIIDNFIFTFFLELVIWESCILLGMIPVNTRYEDVFDHSTVAMQIVDKCGRIFLKSAAAAELPAETFDLLKQGAAVRAPNGQELSMVAIRGGYALWQSDVSQTMSVIDELKKTADRLEQEGELIRQEVKNRSEEASVGEQNRIYNQLSAEVGRQLILLRDMLGKKEWVKDKALLFKKICLVGTYIKRRCNLRLVEQSDGTIRRDDLKMCFSDIAACLRDMGVDADVVFKTADTPAEVPALKPADVAELPALTPEFAIFAFDVFEFLLEYEHFDLYFIKAEFGLSGDTGTGAGAGVGTDTFGGARLVFTVQVRSESGSTGQIPVDELRRLRSTNYILKWNVKEDMYTVSVFGDAI